MSLINLHASKNPPGVHIASAGVSHNCVHSWFDQGREEGKSNSHTWSDFAVVDCWLHRLLREYFHDEFSALELPFPLDVERVVDDFVLFCMLIGNDFLPGECVWFMPIKERSLKL